VCSEPEIVLEIESPDTYSMFVYEMDILTREKYWKTSNLYWDSI
jgi:hypothetical protein